MCIHLGIYVYRYLFRYTHMYIYLYECSYEQVQLAVSLVAKMSSYLSGDKVLFKERAEAETAELSESPMGGICMKYKYMQIV
jgi:hypothetical protein